jgi:hypothetical protein
LFDAFATDVDGVGKVDYKMFAEAIEERGLCHPLSTK